MRDEKGRFIKGHAVPREIRDKISVIFRDRKHAPDCKHCQSLKGRKPWNSGIKIDREKYPNLGHLTPHSEETKQKFKEDRVGEGTSRWKGGISIGENEKDYKRKKCLERVARKMGALGSHTLEEWQELKKKYNYMCLCCKRCEPEISLTEDHVMPLSKGGSDFISNIQPLCKPCNSRKNARHIDYISEFEIKEIKI